MFNMNVLSAPGEVAVSQTSSSFKFQREIDSVGVSCAVTVSTPAVKTFADGDVTVGSDQIAIASHGYKTGLKVALTTDGGLPTGLSATNYYVIAVSSGVIKLATSAANASAGTAVDITAAAGGGTHTLTPAAVSASLILQGSTDGGSNWADITTTAISASGVIVASQTQPIMSLFRGKVSISAGQMTLGAVFLSASDD